MPPYTIFYTCKHNLEFYKLLPLISGLYYKYVTIVIYASSSVNNLRASVNDDARVVIYDRHKFIVQATGAFDQKFFFSKRNNFVLKKFNKPFISTLLLVESMNSMS